MVVELISPKYDMILYFSQHKLSFLNSRRDFFDTYCIKVLLTKSSFDDNMLFFFLNLVLLQLHRA